MDTDDLEWFPGDGRDKTITGLQAVAKRYTGFMDARKMLDCTFTRCLFNYLTTHNATIRKCTFTGCSLSMDDMDQTTITECKFTDCALRPFRFSRKCEFTNNALTDCVLTSGGSAGCGIDLRGTKFVRCTFRTVHFGAIQIAGLRLKDCDAAELRVREIVDETPVLKEKWQLAVSGAKYTGTDQWTAVLFRVGALFHA